MTKSTPASAAHATCSSNIAWTALRRLGVVGVEDVRVADVAGEERAGLVGDLLRERERVPVQLLEQVLLADDAHLLAVRVVGERLDDVGARVHELAMELASTISGWSSTASGTNAPAWM